jgi:hypothetical protein
VRFAHIAAGNTFTTAEIHPAVIEALGCAPEHYTLASLRYDISKLRAKGLVAKLPNSRRYQLLPDGYSICFIFLKLFERVYAPLAAGCPASKKPVCAHVRTLGQPPYWTMAISAEESLYRCSAGFSDFLISANVLAACKKPIGSPADRVLAERFCARWLRRST